MTFSFDTSLATNLDKVRSKIGDTRSPGVLSNEEITAVLAAVGSSVPWAAVSCTRRLIAKHAEDTDTNTVGISNVRSQKTIHLRDLLRELEREAASSGTPQAGGLSRSERESLEADEDFVQPAFSVGRDDYT